MMIPTISLKDHVAYTVQMVIAAVLCLAAVSLASKMLLGPLFWIASAIVGALCGAFYRSGPVVVRRSAFAFLVGLAGLKLVGIATDLQMRPIHVCDVLIGVVAFTALFVNIRRRSSATGAVCR